MLRMPGRWADMEGDSDDESYCAEACLAPCAETATAALSAAEGKKQMAGRGGEQGGSDCRAGLGVTYAGELRDAPQAVREVNRRSLWQPNASSPEFLPTLTMDCQLVHVRFQTESESVEASTASTASSPSQRPSQMPLSMSRAKGIQRPPPLPLDVLQRTKEDDARVLHREHAVRIAKETREYRWLAENRKSLKDPEEAPRTPNWRDHTLSVKRWKYELLQWRRALAQVYLEEEGRSSVVSTECLEEEGRRSVASTEEVHSLLSSMSQASASGSPSKCCTTPPASDAGADCAFSADCDAESSSDQNL